MKDIISRIWKTIDFAIGMAPTAEPLNLFRSFMPACMVYEGFNLKVLRQLIETAKEMADEAKKPVRNILIVMDDCVSFFLFFSYFFLLFLRFFFEGKK